jgi:2-oxoglutarate ferredoxin oxidoreductase subunit delta
MTQQLYGDLDLAPTQERTEFGDGVVTIDEKVCKGCILCSVICPAGLLEMVGEKKERKSHVREGQNNCMACACCEAICESGAIQVVSGYDYGGIWKQSDRGELSGPRPF